MDQRPDNIFAHRRLSVAPMMRLSDRHARYFLRLITRHTLLYTEMVSTGSILRGNRDRFLAFDAAEHPLALQLGGSNPHDLAQCARIGEAYGYDEINLNVGCPSDRVSHARFGACLMAEPDVVAECVAAMNAATRLPVTVKTRIGIDDRDHYEHLAGFVDRVARAGCETFIVHARKAWLQGLSPKENREIPPLRYPEVHRLKREWPALQIVINGGIDSLDQAERQTGHVDGVMIGRAGYRNPYLLAQADRRLFGNDGPTRSRVQVAADMLPYIERRMAEGVPLKAITRHMLGLFQSCPGGRLWRRHLSENAHRAGAGSEVLRATLEYVGKSSGDRCAAA